MSFKKGHKINLGRKRPKQIKQFCLNGHNTFITGRDPTRGCSECRKERDRERSRRDKVKIRMRHRNYYKKNRKRLNKLNIEYRINNPDKYFIYYRKVGTRFSHSKSYAKKLHYKWELTLNEYADLLSKPCYYCGYLLTNEMGVGLDRIDNDKSIGYVMGNVLPCCGLCNVTRSDNFSVPEMLLIGKIIKEIKESRES